MVALISQHREHFVLAETKAVGCCAKSVDRRSVARPATMLAVSNGLIPKPHEPLDDAFLRADEVLLKGKRPVAIGLCVMKNNAGQE
jgi:hypothetical protein